MNVKILVAMHKPYWMPNDDLYLPIHVGSIDKPVIEGLVRDDSGEQISLRNPSFCELTGLYWGWKNVDADYLGLVHYRRYFSGLFRFNKKAQIASRATIERALANADIILPKKRYYYIETNYSQYANAHYEQDLAIAYEILTERHPEYRSAWGRVMRRTSGHRFNIFVMKRNVLDLYLTWLFDILFELEKRLDISSYAGINARVFGLVSERMLDVWLEQNQLSYVELPVVHLERQRWPRKIAAFILRKFRRGITSGHDAL